MKRCNRCGKTKPLEKFNPRKAGRNKFYNACRRCIRSKHLANRYGITIKDFEQILEAQGGGCAVCGTEEQLCVDHCHDKGQVRGILCKKCNSIVGRVDEELPRLLSAVTYLRKIYDVEKEEE